MKLFSLKCICILHICLTLHLLLSSISAYTSGATLSNRLDRHSEVHNEQIERHAGRLSDLGSVHKQTNDRVDNVAGSISRLKMDVKRIEGKMRGELKNRLSNVRSVLLAALDKAKTDISEIRKNVENGISV